MPYKEFEPRDTLEKAMSKLWGADGEAIPTTRLEEMILKIAAAQPSGNVLPAVTATDNGDVLTVVEGAWGKATPSGGAYVITITDGEETGSKVLDKNWTEINTAVRAGQIAIAVVTEDDDNDLSFSIGYVSRVFYNSTNGYNVNIGSDVYTAETATGVLTKASTPK